MQQSGARYITESEVVSLLDLDGAISAYRRALIAWHEDKATNLRKTHVAWGAGTVHALGGALADPACMAVKAWAHTSGGAEPTLLVWDENGALTAIVEAFALGQFRTASASAIATDRLADPDASTLAIIGSGRQALSQVAAVVRVRPIRTIRVHSPTRAHRDTFAAELHGHLPNVTIETADDVPSAVAGAQVVTAATRATAPVLFHADVSVGVHINAIGGITPERVELANDLVGASDLIVSDTPELALANSGELRQDADATPPTVTALSEVVGRDLSRPDANGGITIFKAMGAGLGDVALGAHLLSKIPPEGPRLQRRIRVAPPLFG